MNIAWIGTGIMGKPMALHLAEKHHVTVFNRTFEKAKALEPKVKAKKSIKDTVEHADVVFVMVGYPKDVEEVFLEVFKHVKTGTIIVDMTTSDPKLASKLYELGKSKNIYCLDAPVTGGEKGAIDGTLSIMVGGNQEIFNQVLPLFELLGNTITYVGRAGSGQMTKLTNQIAIAGCLVGVVESLVFAYEHHLDLTKVHQVLSGGSASSNQLSGNGLSIIYKDFRPGFYVKHFYKDLNLALDNTITELPVVKRVRDQLEKLIHEGYENLGTQSLILAYLDNYIVDIDNQK